MRSLYKAFSIIVIMMIVLMTGCADIEDHLISSATTPSLTPTFDTVAESEDNNSDGNASNDKKNKRKKGKKGKKGRDKKSETPDPTSSPTLDPTPDIIETPEPEFLYPEDFDIYGKWKNIGDDTFGQVQRDSVIGFDGMRCNFFSPADTYALYSENGKLKLQVTSVLGDPTFIFTVNVIDDNSIVIIGQGKNLELTRTR